MNIQEAYKEAYKGNSIRRKAWDPGELMGVDGLCLYDRNDKIYHAAILDILADDWEVVQKTMTFQQACQAVEKGKHVTRVAWKTWWTMKENEPKCLINDDLNATDWIVVE